MSKKYTLAEAKQEIARQRCAAKGHVPQTFMRDLGTHVSKDPKKIVLKCDCGEWEWFAARRYGESA